MNLNELIKGAEVISLFCRININTKKELPIRSSEMGLLIFLVKEQCEHTPLMISEFFKVTKPMVTAMVNSLTKKEYIIKIPSHIDKRSFILKPTEKAKLLVEETFHEYYKNMQALKERLGSKKFKNLTELLDEANKILLGEKENG